MRAESNRRSWKVSSAARRLLQCGVAELLKKRGSTPGRSHAGDEFDPIFRELGMPRALEERDIARNKVVALAASVIKDIC